MTAYGDEITRGPAPPDYPTGRRSDATRDLVGPAGRPHPQPSALPRARLPRRRGRAEGPEAARALFAEHGWGGGWVDGVFTFHHFHSTSHEVLAVVAGAATLELGGPQGEAFEVTAGDVLVLPAGTGHRRATDRDGFTVVGAYPRGQEDYDLLRGDDPAEVAAARERIERLAAPPGTRWAGRASAAGVDGCRMMVRGWAASSSSSR